MNEFPRCATCKHWNTAQHPDEHGEVGVCEFITASRNWDNKIIIEEGPAGDATVLTAPDFGCVQHEESDG